MLKKWLAGLMAVLTLLSLAACGKKDADNGTSGATDAIDPLTLLTTVWNSYGDDEKFAVVGGNFSEENAKEGTPGTFSLADPSLLNVNLSFPEADADKLDAAASLAHMLNVNTFTCGAFHLKDGADLNAVAADVKENVMNRQWMCGFPDTLVVASVDRCLISFYGAADLVEQFKQKLVAAYPGVTVLSEDPIA